MTIWNWPTSTISRIIDGDTIVAVLAKQWTATVDIGFNGSSTVAGSVTFLQHLRLNRINAAPKSTPAGQAAMQRTIALTQGALNISTVGAYKYGDSWMCEVVNADGLNVSDQLVVESLAVYWNGQGPRPGG